MTDEERSSERRAAEAKLAEERYQRAIAEENAEEAERTRKLAAFDGLLEALEHSMTLMDTTARYMEGAPVAGYEVDFLAESCRDAIAKAGRAIAAAKETAAK